MSQLVKKYRTIEGEISLEIEEEKSVFIANVKYVETEKDVLDFIDKIKSKYSDANHNCYAYVINQSPEIKRYSDDGEPQGSAGLPMLSVIEKEEVKNVVCLVTRYFGGKKLGKSGLIRTYTRAISQCLSGKVVYKSPYYRLKLIHAYGILGQIENFLNEKKYKIIEKEFLDIVKISLYVKVEEFEEFKNKLIDMTSANIKIDIIDEIMLFEN